MTDVTFQGDPLHLSGTPPQVGDTAPEFQLHETPVDAVEFNSSPDRPLLLTTAPSVDTPVCASQLQTFDRRLGEVGDDPSFDLWFVTRDLPFALDRFADEHDVNRVTTLSDFKERRLGDAFGLEIQELGLLARTVYVIDTDGEIVYREIVSEVADEPNYDGAIGAANEIA